MNTEMDRMLKAFTNACDYLDITLQDDKSFIEIWGDMVNKLSDEAASELTFIMENDASNPIKDQMLKILYKRLNNGRKYQ